MKKIVFALLLSICVFIVRAQVQPVQQKTIGYNDGFQINQSFFPFGDKFYLLQMAGSGIGFDKTINGFGGYDAWILEMNENQSNSKQFLFGGSGTDIPISINKFSNGDLLIAIVSDSDASGNITSIGFGQRDIVVFRYDPINEVIIWQKRFGGDSFDTLDDVVRMENDQFILVCGSNSGVSGNKTTLSFGSFDKWVLKINGSGDILWQKNYGGSESEFGAKIVFHQSRMFLAITSESSVSGNKTVSNFSSEGDIWLLELDLNGNILKQKVFGGINIELLHDMVIMNNSILLSSSSGSGISGNKTNPSFGMSDLWILKLDLSFNIISQLGFGGSQNESSFADILIKENYIYIASTSESGISGSKNSPNYGGPDTWLICLDTNLIEYYQYSVGGDQNEYAAGVYGFQQGQLELISFSNSNISGNKTVNTYGTAATHWLVKLDVPLAVHEVTKSTGVNVYPNPFQSSFSIEMCEYHSFEKLEVLDMNGRILWTENVKGKSSVKSESISNLDNGNYIYRLSGPNSHFVGKIVKMLD